MTPQQRRWVDIIVYTSLAMLNALALWLDKIGEIDLSAITWHKWVSLFVGIITAGLLAIKSTVSQSWTPTEGEKQAAEKVDVKLGQAAAPAVADNKS